MKDKTLYLFFPQWQGSGETKEIYHGAISLKKIIKQDFINISLSTITNNSIERNILAYKQIFDQLKTCSEVINNHAPKKIFSLGGDCGIELAPISYLNKKYKDLAVIWLDAHGDLNTPESSPSKHFHGMPLMTLLGKGEKDIINFLDSRLSTRQLFLVGNRDLDPFEHNYIVKNKLKTFTVNDIKVDEILLVENIKSHGFINIYIHLDLDVIEPNELPCVKCPAVNGLSIKKLTNTLNKLRDSFNVIGGSLCEFISKSPNNSPELKNIVKSLFESYSISQPIIYKN